MSKLENESGNLKEILCAIVDGKQVQYWSEVDCTWVCLKEPAYAIQRRALIREWRIKPDAFEEAWEQRPAMLEGYHLARHFWDKARELTK